MNEPITTDRIKSAILHVLQTRATQRTWKHDLIDNVTRDLIGNVETRVHALVDDQLKAMQVNGEVYIDSDSNCHIPTQELISEKETQIDDWMASLNRQKLEIESTITRVEKVKDEIKRLKTLVRH